MKGRTGKESAVGKGRRIVGASESALELRGLAHGESIIKNKWILEAHIGTGEREVYGQLEPIKRRP